MNADRKNQMSKLMQNAWMLAKTYGLTIREAMQKAWGIFKLKKQMLRGVVKFMYTKLDGTIRMAWGTLKSDIMPAQNNDRQYKKGNNSVFCYYDTDKQAFRCFKMVNFLNIA